MCGIVGIISTSGTADYADKKKYFTNALFADELRGQDATGMFYVPKELPNAEGPFTAGWFKMAAPASAFVRHKNFNEIIFNVDNYKYIIGHNRYATEGSKHKTANAHPFKEKHITLVHNGGVSKHGLLVAHSQLEDVEVDSHVVCHNLAIHEPEEVIPRLSGAYVLIWHDSRDDSLNIIRNSQRPLAITKAKHHDTLYLASEAHMLSWMLHRQNVAHEEIIQPIPGRLFKFTPEMGIKPTVKDIPLYTVPAYRGWGGRVYDSVYYSEYDDAEEGDNVIPFSQGRAASNKQRPPVVGNAGHVGRLDENKINVNGTRIEIPDLLLDNMADYNISPTDTYAFTPIDAKWPTAYDTMYAVVEGFLDDGTSARIYGVPKNIYTFNKDYDWVVKPIGVLEFTPADSTLVDTTTIVQVVKYRVPDDYKFTREFDPEEEEPEEEDQDTFTDNYSDDTLYEGPFKRPIPRSEWLKAVSNGCCMCKESIYPRMAEDIVWLSNGLPVCPDCVLDERDRQASEIVNSGVFH